VSTRRLLPLGVAVTVLLALAGIASHGRPLAGGRGRGPTATFFDYVATTLVIFAIVMLAVVVYTLFGQRAVGGPPRRGRWHLVSAMLSFALSILVATVLLHTGFVQRLRKFEQQLARQQQLKQGHQPGLTAPRNARNARLRWDELGLFIVLIAGTAVLLAATRRSKPMPRPWRLGRKQEVSLAIDESIDDLRNDPNLRRAIVAAYARMEHALGRAGLPRHPAEAPFEYVERALRSLDTSTDSIRRLTALFERAKFSQHEPEPEMRDEAIDALVAVRDELARPVEEAVA
jgi:Domain of unknown function (DUF4129)